MDSFNFYNRGKETTQWRGKLPHREQPEVCYFVTFMARDAVPKAARERWERKRKIWLRGHGYSPDLSREELLELLPPEKRRSFERMLSADYQRTLDGGSGECLLAKSNLRRHVVEALVYHADRTCHMADYVVMPNHVHMLLQPFADESLKKILGSIRSYSAREMNKELGRKGPFWAREPFDHMVRSRHHFQRYQQYIRANPRRAKLREGAYSVGCLL